jgi:uncharacterized membrane protein
MQETLNELFKYLSIELTVLLTAALPVIELKGAIPIGISLGLSPIHSAVISFFGSTFPSPFILFTIRPIFNYLKKTKIFEKIVVELTDKSMAKSGRVQKYGAWGLLIFVAVPLPGTGVWTGSLIAAMLDMRFKWAFPAIFIGNLIACIIILSLSGGLIKAVSG